MRGTRPHASDRGRKSWISSFFPWTKKKSPHHIHHPLAAYFDDDDDHHAHAQKRKYEKKQRRFARNMAILFGIPLIGLFLALYVLPQVQTSRWIQSLTKKDPSVTSCSSQIQTIDPSDEFKPTSPAQPASVDTQIKTAHGSYTIEKDTGNTSFTVIDTHGFSHTLQTEKDFPTHDTKHRPSISANTITYHDIGQNITLTYQTYQDLLKETIILKKPSAIRSFSYLLTVDAQVILDDTQGGMLLGREGETGEVIFSLPTPVGKDKKNHRIDYRYILEPLSDTDAESNRYRVILEPVRPWQFSCASFPVEIDPPISTADWEEALVKVGQNSPSDTIEKDGDIIQIRPQGWQWGASEKKEFAIIRIPKLTEEQRLDMISRTISFSNEDRKEFGDKGVRDGLTPFQVSLISDTGGLVRWGIDYTKIATPEQLKNIRDIHADSPILDARNVPLDRLVTKKAQFTASVIPDHARLAYDPSRFQKEISSRWVKDAQASGPTSKTIGGSGFGRDYTDIASWETAQNGDLVTAREIRIGILFDDSMIQLDTGITIDGSTTSSSYYMKLTVAPSERHTGVANTGVTVNGMDAVTCFTVSDDYFQMEWLAMKNCAGANGRNAVRINNVSVKLGYLFLYSMEDATTSSAAVQFANGSSSSGIFNSIIINADARAIYNSSSIADSSYAENNTVYKTNGTGVEDNAVGGAIAAGNIISVLSGTADFNITSGSQTNTISSDATASTYANVNVREGCGVATSGSYVYFKRILPGLEDLHLSTCDTNSLNLAVDNGTNAVSLVFYDDIDGLPRDDSTTINWDIGADESDTAQNTTPTLYWKFDEGADNTCSGGTNDACDSSKSGIDGAVSSAVRQSADQCVFGNCYLFSSASSTKITASNDRKLSLMPMGNESFTVEAWIKHPASPSGTQVILSKYDSTTGTDGGYKLYMNSDGTITFGTDGNNTSFPEDSASSTASYADNVWHLIMATHDSAGNMHLYVDGVLVGSNSTPTNSVLTNTDSFLVGAEVAGNYFNGYIDEVKIYNYVRETQNDYIAPGAIKGASVNLGVKKTNFLNKNLAVYWKMDENTGTTVADGSGNANTLTLAASTATPTWAAGRFNYSLDFDGTDDYATSANSPFNPSTTDFSVSVWFKNDTLTLVDDIVSQNDGTGTGRSWVQIENSKLQSFLGGSRTIGATTLTTGVWYHGVITKSGTTVKVYLNGVLDATNTKTTESATGTINIGKSKSATNFYDGRLDEVRIYNRMLSASEVSQLYAWGPDPVGYWPMDERTGTTVYDKSGNENNGSIENGFWTTGKYGSGFGSRGNNTIADRIVVTDPASGILDFSNTQDFTTSVWVKVTSSTGDFIPFYKGGSSNSTDGYDIEFSSSAQVVKCGYSDADNVTTPGRDTASSTTNILGGAWHHVECVMDRSGATMGTAGYYIFVDGKLQGSDTSLGEGSGANSRNITIGENDNTLEYGGSTDEVKIYNYARTPAQVIEDMNGGHPLGGSPVGSPVAYWQFDEGVGTTANDQSVNTQSLTLSSSSWTNAGKYNKAWNGTGAVWLSRADNVTNDAFDFSASEDFSISLWFKSDSATNPASNAEYLLTKGTVKPLASPGTAGYAIYANTSGQINFGIKDDTDWGASSPNTPTPDDTVTSTNDIYDNTWHHIVVEKTGTSRIDMYVDGKKQTADTSLAATATLANSISLFVGDDDGDATNSFAGDIDELKVYRAALSQDQVNLEYNRGKAVVFGSLSTNPTGTVADNSAKYSYCPPGNTDTLCGTGDPSPKTEFKFDDHTGQTPLNTGTSTVTSTFGANSSEGSDDPHWAAGKFGSGIICDGVADTVLTSADPIASLTAFTLESWIYPTGTDPSHIIGNGGSPYFEDPVSNGIQLTVNWTVGSSTVVSAAISRYAWHHVVFTYDGANLISYLDGIKGNSTAIASKTTSAGSSMNLCRGNVAFFKGRLDQFQAYSYARSAAQVAWDYNRGAPTTWYKFDECVDSIAYDSAPQNSQGVVGNTATIQIGAGGLDYTTDSCTSQISTSTWSQGYFGKFNSSVYLDSTDDFVSAPDSSKLDMSGDFSTSLWFFLGETFSSTANYTRGLLDKGAYQMFLDKSDGKLKTEVHNGTTAWTQSFNGTAFNIRAMAVYNGNLYAAQEGLTLDGDVLQYNGTTWSTSLNGTREAFQSLAVYNGNLYAGQGNSTGNGDVYTYNGTTWSLSFDGSQEGIFALTPYNGNLYAGQGSGAGDGDVMLYDGSTWYTSLDGTDEIIWQMSVYHGNLYAGEGTGVAGHGDVLSYNGTTWSVSLDGAQESILSLAAYNGSLYAGQGESTGDGDVLSYNGTTWSTSFNGTKEFINSLSSYNGLLYAGQGASAGASDVFQYNGTTWSLSYDGTVTLIRSLAPYNGKFYAGEGNASGNGDIFVLDNGLLGSSTTTSWSAGTWYHIAAVKSGTSLKTYINGNLEGTTTLGSATVETNALNMLLGKLYGTREVGSGDGYFSGGLDEVRTYNYALTVQQIRDLYNGGTVRFAP